MIQKKNSAGITITARGLRHLQKGETLQTFMKEHFLQVSKRQQLRREDPSARDFDTYPISGKYITIAGREFSISKWDSGLTYWQAFTVINSDIIYINQL